MLRQISWELGESRRFDSQRIREKECENSQQPGAAEALEGAQCPITPTAATVLEPRQLDEVIRVWGTKFSLRIPRKKIMGTIRS